MPRKAGTTQLPRMTKTLEFKEFGVTRVPALKSKRAPEEIEELELNRPSKKVLVPAARSIRFEGGVKMKSGEVASADSFRFLTHGANPDLKYLTVCPASAGAVRCFVYSPESHFKYHPITMPCMFEGPVEGLDVQTINQWWVDAELLPSTEVRCLPSPTKGFKAGDFISFRSSPGSYGCIMAVIDRGNDQRLYVVCAVLNQEHRLLMVLPHEVAGPEFTFVNPTQAFWMPDIYPAMRVGDPKKYGFFEPPVHGFVIGDPVTVCTPFSKEPIDGVVEFLTSSGDLPVEYGIKLPNGFTSPYPVDQVYGPLFDRMVPSLDLKFARHPWVDQAEVGILLCDETMPFTPVNDCSQEFDSPGAALGPRDIDLFVTPQRDLITRVGGRLPSGFVENPWPGELIARQCRLFQAPRAPP